MNKRFMYGKVYNDIRCLSTDDKPTSGVKNGSTLVEIDTGSTFLFDAENKVWNEVSGGGEVEIDNETIKKNASGQLYVALPSLDASGY